MDVIRLQDNTLVEIAKRSGLGVDGVMSMLLNSEKEGVAYYFVFPPVEVEDIDG